MREKLIKNKFSDFVFTRFGEIDFHFKAGVSMNGRDIKKETVRIKMGWKHHQTVDPRKMEPLVARGLFGIYPLRKNISFPKKTKIIQKFTQNRQTVVHEISREI